ncbi:ATP-binding protein [Parabacteroides distasonis]|uniref:AAA family ATPase n=1 Tax=Parabacteroides distasonis TaxID=823 RepID=UPI001C385C0B|nr:ATP-binding protein [Parabacteroides distasonis]MBV4225348.1 ATP-binding protein [Parabacteroides distasonis]
MILRTTFENIYSFKERTELSFVAGKGTNFPEHVCRAERRDDISVLKSAIIYGANASGKSNIIKAVDLLKKIALQGINNVEINIFKLSEKLKDSARIEIEIKIGSNYYAYGLIFDIKQIKEEWLYQITSRSDKKIFERIVNDEEVVFNIGELSIPEETKQFLSFLSEGTPKTKSFLSEYKERNGKGIDAITDVYNWFEDDLKIIFPSTRFGGLTFKMERDSTFSKAIKSLLKYFNTGIVGVENYKIKKESITDIPKKIVDDFLKDAKPNESFFVSSENLLSNYFFKTNSKGETSIFKQKTIHKNIIKEDVVFEMQEESDGSLRLLDFIPCLIDLKLNSSVYLIDEIDRSMHPMLTRKFFDYYYNNLSSDKNTQLVCTTHESNLLDLNLVRADEVWFVEKEKQSGASHLSSLAEYKPREDIRKGYLQGRYGAIPFFADINKLSW